MKTTVNFVLVIPDDPCLTQPVAVKIRTEDGDLMRRRLYSLLKDNKVVFCDERLINELIDEFDKGIEQTESWMSELMLLKCQKDLILLRDMRQSLSDGKDRHKTNSIWYLKICFACHELWRRMIRDVEGLQIVQMLKAEKMKKN